MSIFRKIFSDFLSDTDKRREREFLPSAVEFIHNPPRPFARLALWTIVLLLTFGIIWSIVGYVDEVAVAPGKIIPKGYVKTIQSEDGGVIKKIAVNEGQFVKKGQLLVELDATINHADLKRLRADADYYRMQIDYLRALITGGNFHATKEKYPAQDVSNIRAQNILFENKKDAIRSKLRLSDADIAAAQAGLTAEIATENKYRELLKNSTFIEDRANTSNKQDGLSLFQLYDYKNKKIELQENFASQTALVAKAHASVTQSEASRANVRESLLDELNTKLVENEHTLDQSQAELEKIERKNSQATILSPIDGYVSQISIRTIGGVLTQAQAIMTIVPANDTLAAECWVANKDVGFVKIGQRAQIKMDTFNFQKFGLINATVESVSPDAIEHDTGNGQKEYAFRAVLKLERDYVMINDKKARLTAGMDLTGEILLRKKRIIDFFLEPFQKYTGEAFRER
ncbi:MAG: HlyD family type I secretion periplasmic adaptor subunit [Negativicutes bacterium]|jgi:hemolysin D